MDYLTHSRNFSVDLDTKYSSHLTASTQFPQISTKHNDLIRNNLLNFYPQHGSMRRSYTTLASTQNYVTSDKAKPVIIPLYKNTDSIQSLRSSLCELDGLKVPDIYSSNRNALYTRHTVNDWIKSAQNVYGNSDRIRGVSERVRGDSLRLVREFDDRTSQTQDDSTHKLGNRVTDINHVKSNLDSEIDEIIKETNLLISAKIVAEKALTESENPLHISQECLYNREKRAGIDLVHDDPEKELLREIDIIKHCQDKISYVIQKANEQIRLNRNVQHELEKDTRDKYHALKVDQLANNYSNSSAGISYHNGVEFINNCVSTPETWMKFTTSNLQRSWSEREASRKLREEIELCLNQCQNDMWKKWMGVNNSLSKRVQETTDARNKDQAHLKNILQEIFDMEKNIEYLKKAIIDKEAPLKVAQSRLFVRLDRPNMEACNDVPRNRLIQEVEELKNSMESLKNQLRLAENTLQNLLMNKSDVESDLNLKTNSLFIDREKCLGIRKTFSMNAGIKI